MNTAGRKQLRPENVGEINTNWRRRDFERIPRRRASAMRRKGISSAAARQQPACYLSESLEPLASRASSLTKLLSSPAASRAAR